MPRGASVAIMVMPTAPATYNLRLSERRARAVRKELIRLVLRRPISAPPVTARTRSSSDVKEPQNRRATIDLE
jgi:outer membrane protein OmpA-like peptidoglycan-associated protein